MWDMIYSFGIGISFAVGVGLGAYLCRVSTKKCLKEDMDYWKKHQEKVEKRLLSYVSNTKLIADALDRISKK